MITLAILHVKHKYLLYQILHHRYKELLVFVRSMTHNKK